MTRQSTAPYRALTAVALCDGHDAAIVAVSRALRRSGFEVVYIGFNRSPRDIVRAAIEEDVDVVGISSYNGGHSEFLGAVLDGLRAAGAAIPVVAGGGGTITPEDEEALVAMGVARVFPPGMTLAEVASQVADVCAEGRRVAGPSLEESLGGARAGDARLLARALTLVESDHPGADPELDGLLATSEPAARRPLIVGITGNGGAGKSTLIDELLLRFADGDEGLRVGVLCCDPTTQQDAPQGHTVGGALLGDRIRMLAADRDRVFIRSMATRQHPGGVSASLARAVKVLSVAPFDVVILESAGIGQADNPFAGLVDLNLYVMTSEFGSALQLEKTVMLEQADIVVLNKCDQPAAPAALKSVQARLRSAGRGTLLFGATAARHRDPGVDAVFMALRERARREGVAVSGDSCNRGASAAEAAR